MRHALLKHLLPAALLMLSPGMAAAQSLADTLSQASGELRVSALQRADALRVGPTAPAVELTPTDGFVVQAEDFSLQALQLSRSIEAANGPADLRCIFRGMSADAGAQLDTLFNAQTRADQARVYLAMASLFEDAERIAADPEAGVEAPASCPASEL
ncbi:MAG: hypothetical protein AAFX09_07065 [Pseudomonadota bacterium]